MKPKKELLEFKEGTILWHPQLDVIIEIVEIFDDDVPDYEDKYIRSKSLTWFSYDVLKTNNRVIEAFADYNLVAFTLGRKHNGWDYRNIIGKEFIVIHGYNGAVPQTYRSLYGK